MEAITFTPAQVQVFNLVSHIKTATGLEQLRKQLAAFYAKQIDYEMDALWESGQFDEKRMKELRGSHFRTPYNKYVTMNPVVIDTNCLLQIISRRSPYRPIWDAFLAGRFTLCASNEILDEYQEILEQQISPTVAENVVMLILNQENVQLVDPHFRMGIITADPDDNKFVDCAFAAGADYLVSEDSHFRVLHDRGAWEE